MENQPLVSVVMATYNGERYLAAQLDSIFSQTYSHIEVVVSDDQSNDATPDILQAYSEKFNLRYSVNEARQGVIRNFENAISNAKGAYIALCDQDDVWLPQKLEISLYKLIQLEGGSSTSTPVLVFSDLKVVDENLQIIDPSYWNFMQLNPDNTQLNRILVENVVTGCTAIMNRATADMGLPIPQQALMHDIWLLMIASSFGRVGHLKEKTVLYRQHEQNVVGARQQNLLQKLSSGLRKISNNNFSLLQQEVEQAAAFHSRYSSLFESSSDAKATLEAFMTLKEKNFIQRKYTVLKYSFYGSTLKKAINVLLRA